MNKNFLKVLTEASYKENFLRKFLKNKKKSDTKNTKNNSK